MIPAARLMASGVMVAALVSGSFASGEAQEYDPGRLYARINTMDGTVFEGFVRWDKNEGHWADMLDASKRIPRRFIREAEALSGQDSRGRERGVVVLGFRVGGEGSGSRTASSGIRMGHIDKIQVLDDDYALLLLKSGEEQEFRRRSTDLGSRNRGIVVTDPARGEATLEWEDVDTIEFMSAPAGVGSPFGERLYGTLQTRSGHEFTGWITWDMDEIFGTDELDGDRRGRRRSIPFGRIASIERGGSSRSVVTLRDGEELTLRGTNDVNDGNRGIAVGDPGLGQARVDWDEFESVRFAEPPTQLSYDAFDGGSRMFGAVRSRDGEVFSGAIRWDNDEYRSWEILDGEADGIELDIEFGLIQSIRRVSSRRAEVTLRDGRQFELQGSNDVNDGNKGVFVTQESGETVMLEWDEFDRVDFVRP